jgi:hypothetical protein
MFECMVLKRIVVFCVFGLGFVIFGLALTPNLTYGQDSGWTSAERLSAKGQTSWFPDVAIDPAGTVHIVWSSGFIDYDLVLHTAFLLDGTQLEPIEIRAMYKTGGEATRPNLVADRSSILHLSFRDTQVYYSQVNASQAHSAKYWKPDTSISEGYFTDMAVDSKFRIHYIYTRNVISGACPVCYHVFYVWSDDDGETWSKEKDISIGPLGAAKPQLIIDQTDNLHVVWESGIGGGYGQLTDTDPTQVMYVSSYDNGETWENPLQLNPGDMVAKSITIGLDGQDKLIVVWWNVEDDNVYYQISPNLGKNWSLPTHLPGVLGVWSEYHARLDDYSMATDSNGDVHLVFSGRFDKAPLATEVPKSGVIQMTPTPTATPQPTDGRARLSLLHMVWDGKSWGEAEAVASYVGDVPEWPRIAVGLGNQLHVVWFVRSEKDIWKGGGDYTVWYSSKQLESPRYTPALYPTVIPQATVGATQAVVETPTITPVMDLPENVPVKTGQLVYKEMDYIEVAGFSILPVVLLVVFLFIINRKFRH